MHQRLAGNILDIAITVNHRKPAGNHCTCMGNPLPKAWHAPAISRHSQLQFSALFIFTLRPGIPADRAADHIEAARAVCNVTFGGTTDRGRRRPSTRALLAERADL